jgi:hypothetical protein
MGLDDDSTQCQNMVAIFEMISNLVLDSMYLYLITSQLCIIEITLSLKILQKYVTENNQLV